MRKSVIIISAAVCVLAIAVAVMMNNEIFIKTDPADRAISNVQRTENYSPVIEHNREKMENVMDYGPEVCRGYVTTSDDEERVREILTEVKRLSDEICAGAVTDMEKVQAIEQWVADNLYYNHVAAETEVTPDVISLETVLGTKTATCAGYSNMFSALCGMQGLYCVNLRGGTYAAEDTPDNLLAAPMNHEWNAVLLDGQWQFIDTTWLSNNEYTEDGYVHWRDKDEEYRDMDFEYMCYEHRIDLVDHRDFRALMEG